MKVYFEDGELRSISQFPIHPDFIIDAKDGVTANFGFLDYIREHNNDCTIYTNTILAFDNKYVWNSELKVPEIYIRTGKHMIFTRIDDLTERELREGHMLARLYVAGEFGGMPDTIVIKPKKVIPNINLKKQKPRIAIFTDGARYVIYCISVIVASVMLSHDNIVGYTVMSLVGITMFMSIFIRQK